MSIYSPNGNTDQDQSKIRVGQNFANSENQLEMFSNVVRPRAEPQQNLVRGSSLPKQNDTNTTRAHRHGEHHWKPHRSNHLSFTLLWQTGGCWWQPLLDVPHRKSQQFERDIFTQQSTIHDAWHSFRSLSHLSRHAFEYLNSYPNQTWNDGLNVNSNVWVK
jgi:hypothetical protein